MRKKRNEMLIMTYQTRMKYVVLLALLFVIHMTQKAALQPMVIVVETGATEYSFVLQLPKRQEIDKYIRYKFRLTYCLGLHCSVNNNYLITRLHKNGKKF